MLEQGNHPKTLHGVTDILNCSLNVEIVVTFRNKLSKII